MLTQHLMPGPSYMEILKRMHDWLLPASYLEIGTRSADEVVTYSDVDLKFVRVNGDVRMTRKSGEPY